jgi:hypothetical protein
VKLAKLGVGFKPTTFAFIKAHSQSTALHSDTVSLEDVASNS